MRRTLERLRGEESLEQDYVRHLAARTGSSHMHIVVDHLSSPQIVEFLQVHVQEMAAV